MRIRREWAVEYPGGLTHVSDDRAYAEEFEHWIIEGKLVTRQVGEGEWRPPDQAGPDVDDAPSGVEHASDLLARLAWLLISRAGGTVKVRAADVLGDHRYGVMTIATIETGLDFTIEAEQPEGA